MANKKKQTAKCQLPHATTYCGNNSDLPTSHTVVLKEIQGGPAMMLIILHVCFSVRVTFDCTSICEVSCLWNRFYKQEVCGPTFWMKRAS